MSELETFTYGELLDMIRKDLLLDLNTDALKHTLTDEGVAPANVDGDASVPGMRSNQSLIVPAPRPGTATQNNANLQRILDATTNVILELQGGNYQLNDDLDKTGGSLHVRGQGMGVSLMTQTVDADVFDFVATGGGQRFSCEGVSFIAANGGAMATGAAVRVNAAHNAPGCTVKDCEVETNTTDRFKYGVFLIDPAETNCDNVTISAADEGFHMETLVNGFASAASPNTFNKCSVYGGTYGLRSISTTSPGLEGTEVTNCNLVGMQYGIHATSTSYAPPGLLVSDTHINVSVENIHASNITQMIVHDSLFYNTGSTQMLNLSDVGYSKIHDTLFFVNSPGDAYGIRLASPNGITGVLSIHDNQFALAGGSAKSAIVSNTDPIFFVKIHDNASSGGPGSNLFFQQGYFHPTIEVYNNSPLDAIDQFQAISISGAGNDTLDISTFRSNWIAISNPGVARTVKTIVARHLGETITFQVDSANITIAHGTGNIALKGAANLVGAAGTKLLLREMAGTFYEVGRVT